jgi:aspartate beta-hydroxylase
MISEAEAQLLLRQGRLAEAERAFASLLEKDPANVQALNVMALAAFREDDLQTALTRIGTALRVDGGNPVTLHNRGRILEGAGQYAEAAASQRAALQLVPNLHAARLHLGRALELSGDTHGAIIAYARALQDAQGDGRWLNQATTPPAFQPLIEHAVRLVRSGRRAALDALLEPVVARYGADALLRVQTGLRAYFNLEAPRIEDPRQRPTFFHLPDIPARAFPDVSLFPWIADLEAAAADIRGELHARLQQDGGRERVFSSNELEAENLRGLREPPSWSGYYFYRHGEPRQDNRERCPITAAAIDALPLCRIRDHGPEVLFSVFTPGTHLLPHRGVTNSRLVGHLPLMVPENCALVVGGEEHRWREGKVIVFDDTFEHEAWNRSERTRIVLIFDIWSPYLTEAERTAMALVIGDMGDFRHAVGTAA